MRRLLSERRNPPPRQKACAACTKAKRRCDFVSPSCARCSMRCIPCEYPSRTLGASLNHRRSRAGARQDQGHNSSQTEWTAEDFTDDDMSLTLAGPRSLTGARPDPVPTPPASLAATTPDSGLDGFMDSIDPCLTSLDSSSTPLDILSDETTAALRTLQFSDQLTVPQTKTLEAMSEVIAKHLQFAIDVLNQAPASMVQTLSTPWSHHHLYKENMPKSIRGMSWCRAPNLESPASPRLNVFPRCAGRLCSIHGQELDQRPRHHALHRILLY